MANEIIKNYGSTGRILTQPVPLQPLYNITSTWLPVGVPTNLGPLGNSVSRIAYLSSSAVGATSQIYFTPIVGATITGITLDYVITGNRSRTPLTNRLGINCVRNSFLSGTEASLFSGGFQSVPLYSTMANSAGSNTFTTDQNNVVTPGFYYYLLLIEEAGTGSVAGNYVYNININYTTTSPII